MPVVDASVLVSLYAEGDTGFPAADRWAKLSFERETWHLPTIALAEVASSLARVGVGKIDGLAIALELEASAFVMVHSVDSALGRNAARIGSEQRIKGCDAVYVALAAQLDDVLVTFDREQSARAGAVVRVLVPE